uniref:EF-hand domain-containing protein n=1 Tax=Macrostomum lignano TaxID=282301 RepID=A0A1I8F2D7_9PLAT
MFSEQSVQEFKAYFESALNEGEVLYAFRPARLVGVFDCCMTLLDFSQFALRINAARWTEFVENFSGCCRDTGPAPPPFSGCCRDTGPAPAPCSLAVAATLALPRPLFSGCCRDTGLGALPAPCSLAVARHWPRCPAPALFSGCCRDTGLGALPRPPVLWLFRDTGLGALPPPPVLWLISASSSLPLSSLYVGQMSEAFNMIDINKDGFIDAEDLSEILVSLGKNEVGLQQYAEEMRGPGPIINFTMFLTLFGEKMSGSDPEETIKNAFGCFDPEGSGQISEERLREILTTMGDRWTDEQSLTSSCTELRCRTAGLITPSLRR